MHDVLDAKWLLDHHKDETYMRCAIKPLEAMLTSHKRIIMKVSVLPSVLFTYFDANSVFMLMCVCHLISLLNLSNADCFPALQGLANSLKLRVYLIYSKCSVISELHYIL